MVVIVGGLMFIGLGMVFVMLFYFGLLLVDVFDGDYNIFWVLNGGGVGQCLVYDFGMLMFV